MSSTSSLNALEKRAAGALAAVFGFRMLGLFMLMPVFALYGSDLDGFSPLWIGIAIGAYGLTQALLQIPMGILSDRIGRKPVIIGGLLLFTLGSIIAAFAESVYMVAIGRAVQGTGAIAAAILALAADLSREEQRPKVMATIGMCIGLSFSIALVVGPMVAEYSGLSGLFWLTALLALVGIAIITLFVPSSVNKAPKGETITNTQSITQLLQHPQLFRLDLGVLLLHLLMTAVFVSMPVVLLQNGMAAPHHWHLYLPVLLASFVLMVPFIIIAAKKQKEKAFFIAAILALSFSLLLMFLGATSLPILTAGLLLFFVGFNYLEASLPALVSRIAPAGQKGSAMGIFSSSQFLGAFLGGVFGGYIANMNTPETVFAACSMIGLLWAVAVSGMRIPTRSTLVNLDSTVSTEQAAGAVASQLVQLEGVLEATVVLEENRTYLKVDSNSFNIEQAKQIVASAS